MDGVVWELNPDQAPPKRCLLKSGVVRSTQGTACAAAWRSALLTQHARPCSKTGLLCLGLFNAATALHVSCAAGLCPQSAAPALGSWHAARSSRPAARAPERGGPGPCRGSASTHRLAGLQRQQSRGAALQCPGDCAGPCLPAQSRLLRHATGLRGECTTHNLLMV